VCRLDPRPRGEARRTDRASQPDLVTAGPPGGLGVTRPRVGQPPRGAPRGDELGSGEPDADPRVAAESPPQPLGHPGVALDGDHAGPSLGQPGRDRAAAGPEVEDEPALGRAAAADELVDRRVVTQ
jgi:hypothetical protein